MINKDELIYKLDVVIEYLKNNGGYVSEFLCTPNFIEVDPLTQSKYLLCKPRII